MNVFDPWAGYFPEFLQGLGVTIQLTFFALLIGIPLGAIFALLGLHSRRIVRYASIALVEIGRGIPGLVVLYLVYFGFPQVDLVLPAFASAVIGLAFTTAAYTSEIIRGGIRSIDRGQFEAAAALSLSPSQEMMLVILPQAIKRVIPPLIGFGVLLYQGTSLAYAISVPELLSRAYNTATITYQFTSAFLLAGVMYAVISLAVTMLSRVTLPRRKKNYANPYPLKNDPSVSATPL